MANTNSSIGFVVGFIVFVISLSVFALYDCTKNDKGSLVIPAFCISVALGLVTGFVITTNGEQVPTGISEYKATISEEVRFIDVYTKYEILGLDGQIFTLQNKAQVDSDL